VLSVRLSDMAIHREPSVFDEMIQRKSRISTDFRASAVVHAFGSLKMSFIGSLKLVIEHHHFYTIGGRCSYIAGSVVILIIFKQVIFFSRV
jgi:hypothetical protein